MASENSSKRSRTITVPSYLDDYAVEGVFSDIQYTTWEEEEDNEQDEEGMSYKQCVLCTNNAYIQILFVIDIEMSENDENVEVSNQEYTEKTDNFIDTVPRQRDQRYVIFIEALLTLQ